MTVSAATLASIVEAKDSKHALSMPVDKKGFYVRPETTFRNTISSEPGAQFAPEKGRYHLYISYGCPWAHRTLLLRALKGLEGIITVDAVHWFLDERGWQFTDGYTDSLYDTKFIKELYYKTNPDYVGRFTVPILWDMKTETIVNNESAEIIRILNTAFNDFITPENASRDFYPEPLRAEIDQVNQWVYETINNGVYKVGFSTSQEAYDQHIPPLFDALDKIEATLGKDDYLVGNTLTEADVRAWTSIIRFDPVYHTHFKCNIKSIEKDYPNILKWARRIYQLPGVAETVDMDFIKKGYYKSDVKNNPNGVVPAGNGPNLAQPIV
ncbi:S-glutathionyl-(chloro)hydroquinone reductase [Podila verticillata]|nr:S-glutathionyl-(chloro)hydroquinone reductase [Podila verticillata]